MKKRIILYGLMVLFLSLFLIFLIMDISIFKISYVTSKLEENNYYNLLYEKIYNTYESKLSDLNMEDIYIDKIIDVDMIKNDIKNYLEGYYKGESYILHTIEIETKLNKLIDDYLINNKIEVEDENIIKNEVNYLVNYYEKEIKANNVLDEIPSSFNIFKKICTPIMIISVISVFIIYLYVLFKIKSKPLGKIFMTTSIILFLSQLFLQNKISVNKLYTNDFLKTPVNMIKNDILFKLDVVCILIFISGIIFFIFEKMFERK